MGLVDSITGFRRLVNADGLPECARAGAGHREIGREPNRVAPDREAAAVFLRARHRFLEPAEQHVVVGKPQRDEREERELKDHPAAHGERAAPACQRCAEHEGGHQPDESGPRGRQQHCQRHDADGNHEPDAHRPQLQEPIRDPL